MQRLAANCAKSSGYRRFAARGTIAACTGGRVCLREPASFWRRSTRRLPTGSTRWRARARSTTSGNSRRRSTAAEQARLVPARAEAADLIAARAYLERFRESADVGRSRRTRAIASAVSIRSGSCRASAAEFIVGLGETLFFDGSFGAAADLFDRCSMRRRSRPPRRASACSTGGRARSTRCAAARRDRTPADVQRIRDRMQRELGAHPASASARVLAGGRRPCQGDLQAAWDAAQAGVGARAARAGSRRRRSRADHRHGSCCKAIVPERAKMHRSAAGAGESDWEQFKERWKR